MRPGWLPVPGVGQVILTPESTRLMGSLTYSGLIVGEFWVYVLHTEPQEFTGACPECGDDITWLCWWFEGVPLAGGNKQDMVTVTEPGPCRCDDVQVRQEVIAA